MRRGEATLGLRYFTDVDPGLVSELVTEEAFVVACSPEHRLAGRRCATRPPSRASAG